MNHVYVNSCCPHCKRSSHFPIEVLGLRSACRHCAKAMTVRDADNSQASQSDSMGWWLRFTESGSRMSPEFEMPEKTLPR